MRTLLMITCKTIFCLYISTSLWLCNLGSEESDLREDSTLVEDLSEVPDSSLLTGKIIFF